MKKITYLASLISLLICSFAFAENYIISFQPTKSFSADGIKPEQQAARFLNIDEENVLRVFSTNQHSIAVADITEAQAKELAKIAIVEKDYTLKTHLTPNDTFFPLQWGLKRIDSERAWDRVTGSPGSVVAVIDTGADLTHPDLVNSLWKNPREVPKNGIDDDGNGYVDDVNGYDFGDRDSDPTDSVYHGTHVAGIIAATGNNLRGVAGVAFSNKIMVLKTSRGESLSGSAVLEAIKYVVDQKRAGVDVSVINMSLGGNTLSEIEIDLMRYALAHDIVVVASAGNEASNNDIIPVFPAQHNLLLKNVISVAAIDDTGSLASFSNYGFSVNLAAPGVDILSTLPVTPEGAYGFLDGTSMSAPYVSGVVALMHAINPRLKARTLRDILFESVRDNADLTRIATHGELDAYTAILNSQFARNTFQVSGIISDSFGNPLGGVTVQSELETTTTNSGGYYQIDDVPEGYDLTIRAVSPYYEFSPASYRGLINFDAKGDFSAKLAQRTIGFRVILDKKKIPNAKVTLAGGGINRTVKTDKKGLATFRGIYPGTYTVKFKINKVKLKQSSAAVVVGAQDNVVYTVRYKTVRF